MPCPLFENDELVQQPADLLKITATYMNAATSFIKTKAGALHGEIGSHLSSSRLWIIILSYAAAKTPFFLYVAFQHTHKPQFAGKDFSNTTLRGAFGDALAELDWGVGQVTQALKDANVENDTFVFFSSDNG